MNAATVQSRQQLEAWVSFLRAHAAITRNFRVRDRGTVSFRCEAINVFNRVNFGLPVDYVDVKNAGQLLSADPGRTFQMGLRVRF